MRSLIFSFTYVLVCELNVIHGFSVNVNCSCKCISCFAPRVRTIIAKCSFVIVVDSLLQESRPTNKLTNSSCQKNM